MSCDLFKRGDWVAYEDDVWVVDAQSSNSNAWYWIYKRQTTYQFGWHDPRIVFSGGRVPRPDEKLIEGSLLTLIPQEVADIMKGV